MTLRLYNTLTRRKEDFRPLDADNVRIYVCGPTVYDFAHIGNARPAIVFDVLFRLLRHLYGADHVTYARNITDVDDKINARAGRDFPDLPLNEAIRKITAKTEKQFHDDIRQLGVLTQKQVNRPGQQPRFIEPRATEHIDDMKAMIERLRKSDCAYVEQDHVLFQVAKMSDYGVLSHRSLEEMVAGARVEVAPYKRDPMDFVLWKPSKPGEPAWPSPCGIEPPGRPGWHIECSAMAWKHLGETFDIHGGGIDLVFPHHENELAQSRCALGVERMAQVWMHNGFLQVEGRKMAKSEGNFVTINDLLNTNRFGGSPWSGPVIRLAMLRTHYSQPLDWTVESLYWADDSLYKWSSFAAERTIKTPDKDLHQEFMSLILDDLNTPGAISVIEKAVSSASPTEGQMAFVFSALKLLGFESPPTKTKRAATALTSAARLLSKMDLAEVRRIAERVRRSPVYKNGQLRPETKLIAAIRFMQTVIKARELGNVKLSASLDEIYLDSFSQLDVSAIEKLKEDRSAARLARNWSEADRIRDELAAMGIVLHDTKDPETGNPLTEWEPKR